MRKGLTIAMVLLGALLMVVGYTASAPWGASTVADSDPAFGFAPTLFVLGVVVAFGSALVYEILPDRDR